MMMVEYDLILLDGRRRVTQDNEQICWFKGKNKEWITNFYGACKMLVNKSVTSVMICDGKSLNKAISFYPKRFVIGLFNKTAQNRNFAKITR